MSEQKDFEDKLKIEKDVSPQSRDAFDSAYAKIRQTKPSSRRVFNKKYLAIAAGILIIGGGITWQTLSVLNTNSTQPKITQTRTSKDFYYTKIKRINSGASTKSANSPQTFSQLLAQSDLLVKGEVIELSAHQVDDRAFTLATIVISQNIKKPTQRVGQKIKVLFIGGNFQDKKTGEKYVLKEEGQLLPKMNQKLILDLAKAPKGSNDIDFEHYMPTFTFYQNKNNQYQTEKLSDVYGGKKDGTQVKHKSDEQMNNEKIAKELNDYLKKNNLN